MILNQATQSSVKINWDLNILAIVTNNLMCLTEHTDWQITLSNAGSFNRRQFNWLKLNCRTCKVLDYGWKIHISASLFNASEVLEIILPLLFSFKFNIKIVDTIDFLAYLNDECLNSSQVGKFITIYPDDERKAVEFAQLANKKTTHLISPNIISDRQFAANSIIYYRFGAFITDYVQTLAGGLLPTMQLPQGKIFDLRDPNAGIYASINDPFNPTFGKIEKKQPNSRLINHFIYQYYCISQTNHKKVVLCLDLKENRRCILKIAKPHIATDSLNNDAITRLRCEELILLKCQDLEFIPKVYYSFSTDDNSYGVVLEDIEGITLYEFLRTHLTNQTIIPLEELLNISKQIAEMINKLHTRNIVHADLKLSNFLLLKDKTLKLIDFDSACDFTSKRIICTSGTTGFINRNRQLGNIPTIQDDIYSFGTILYYLFSLINPDSCPLEIGQDNIVNLRYYNNDIPQHIEMIIKDCLSINVDNFNDICIRLYKQEHLNLEKPTPILSNELQNYQEKSIFLVQEYIKQVFHADKNYYDFSQSLGGDFIINDLRGLGGALLSLCIAAINNPNTNLHTIIQTNIFSLTKEKPYNSIPGLYVGESGIALALLYAAMVLKDQQLHNLAYKHIKKTNQQKYQAIDFGSAKKTYTINIKIYSYEKFR